MEINIRKTLQAPVFSYIFLNIFEKAVSYFLLIILGNNPKSALQFKQKLLT